MQNLSDDANIYLIPASSAEDEQLIEMCLKSGLDQTTVDNLGVDSLEGQIDLAEFSSPEDNKFIKKLKKKNNNISSNLTEQNAELLNKYSEIVKSAENDFRLLRESSYQTDEGSIKCWPINQSNKEQYGFTKGDLLLFYTGDGFYRWAGIFEKDHVLPDLIKLILKDPSRKRSYFLELSNLRQIQLDSSVMAELTGRDLDSVQKISPLSGAAKGGIINHFGSLSEFVDEALSGINTLLSYSEQATSDVWDTTESKTADSDTKSGAEISESPPTGGQQQTGAVDVGQSETVEQDTTTFVDSKEDSKNKWQDLAQQLHQSKQVVMVGPQGTGKRRVVANLLSNWVEERGRVSKKNRIVRTQFTASTDYSEFILGQYGDRADDDQLVRGPFGKFIDIAAAETSQFIGQDYDSPPKYVLVIEGFQNVNTPEVFGEFYQALHPRNRGPQNEVDVTGAKATLWVPEEVYIVGIADVPDINSYSTNNTIRSPFVVEYKRPDYDILYDMYDYSEDEVLTAARDGELPAESIVALEALNQYLQTADESNLTQIGHMYLSKDSTQLQSYNADTIHEAWQYDILPTVAGLNNQHLAGLQNGPLENVSSNDSPMRLGRLQSDSTQIEKIIKSLAESHPEY